MSSISLPIAIVGGSGKGQLKVEGTVLVYSRKTWFFESTLLIPVESARMSEHPRFHKDLSILAFLIPVITIVLAVALVLCTRVANIEGLNREVLIVVSATAIFVIVLLELWLLFGYLMSFLFTKNSICLTFGDGNMQIEFWKTKKVARLMDSFEKVIREKQTRIQESTLKPSTEVFEIYEAMEALTTRPELREKLKRKGLERSTKFTWEEAARQTLKIYEKIFAEGKVRC